MIQEKENAEFVTMAGRHNTQRLSFLEPFEAFSSGMAIFYPMKWANDNRAQLTQHPFFLFSFCDNGAV